MDDWVVAPEKSKWEHLLRIETILAFLGFGPGGKHSQAEDRPLPDSRSEQWPEASVFVNNQQPEGGGFVSVQWR